MSCFAELSRLVFAEPRGMKRPGVVCETGGIQEVVAHGGAGFLSPPRDVPPLAANILTLLRDPTLRARMGENGRRRVEAAFMPCRMASDAERLYEPLLHPNRNRTTSRSPAVWISEA